MKFKIAINKSDLETFQLFWSKYYTFYYGLVKKKQSLSETNKQILAIPDNCSLRQIWKVCSIWKKIYIIKFKENFLGIPSLQNKISSK